MKENRKGLGMGLDLLLKASSQNRPKSIEEGDLILAQGLYKQALEQEDIGNCLEAYYYYRRVIDFWPEGSHKHEDAKVKLLSQSLNNAATILFEYGHTSSARECLEKALLIDVNNSTAQENLELILKEES